MSSSDANGNDDRHQKARKITSSSYVNLASEVLAAKSNFDKSAKKSRLFKTPSSRPFHKVDSLNDSKGEDDEWEKSRVALEKKAAIYEKLKSGSISSKQAGIEESLFVPSYEPSTSKPPVDFVSKLLETEIVDEFGRTRKVSILDVNTSGSNRKYEADLKPMGEVRTRGVGFYSFSTDSRIRENELSELRRKRLETLSLRSTQESLTERRREYRAKRLEIALERKRRLLSRL